MAEIIGLGGLVYDFVCKVDSMPSVGETKMAYEMKTNLGGKSSNAVVQASLLGNVSTAFIGKVGDDHYGLEQIDDLREYHVNVDNVMVTNKKPTSRAMITIDRTGNNQIVLATGADQLVTVADIVDSTEMISRSKVLISSFEVPMETCLKALSIARQNNITTILVPSPVPINYTAQMLPEVDILCPNEVEAGQLLNMKIDDVETAKKGVEKFFELGRIRWPIITLGDKGALVGIRPGLMELLPAPKVNVVDTTGAGDSFVGSLAFHLVKNPSTTIDDKVAKSVYIASMSTTKYGTRLSYITNPMIS